MWTDDVNTTRYRKEEEENNVCVTLIQNQTEYLCRTSREIERTSESIIYLILPVATTKDEEVAGRHRRNVAIEEANEVNQGTWQL